MPENGATQLEEMIASHARRVGESALAGGTISPTLTGSSHGPGPRRPSCTFHNSTAGRSPVLAISFRSSGMRKPSLHSMSAGP